MATQSVSVPADRSLRFVGIRRSDPRLVQIAILATFTLLGQTFLQFPIMPAQILVAVLAACATEMGFALRKRTVLFPASALISALSLGLLLRPGYMEVVGTHRTFILYADNLWLHALAGFLAIASKQWITYRGKHLFNPTNFAIVLLALLLPGIAQVTPAQWGGAAVLLFVVANCGYLMTYRVRRFHLIAAFWSSYAACHALVLLAQHKPMYLWWDGVTSGAVLLFTFFMITDPRTSPASVRGRVVYGLLTSVIYALLALLNVPIALLVALVLACCLVPWIDRRFGGEEQTWRLLSARPARRVPERLARRLPGGVAQRRLRLASGVLLAVTVASLVPTRPVLQALREATLPPSPMLNRIAAPVRPLLAAAVPATAHASGVLSATIDITDQGFVSPVITVTAGMQVNWMNSSGSVRRVVESGDVVPPGGRRIYLPLVRRSGAAGVASEQPAANARPAAALFDSGDLKPTETYSYRFDSPGTYRYSDPRVPEQRGEVRVFPGRTVVRGRIQTSERVPMPGVHVFLQGGPTVSAITAADGSYELNGVPIGRVDIAVDGRTTTLNDGRAYPFYNFMRQITPGPLYVIQRPTFLPAVMTDPVPVPAGQTVKVTNDLDPRLFGIELQANGDTIQWPPGVAKQLSIDWVPVDRAPSNLPAFMRPAVLITVQPAGMRFTQPAPVTFPNWDNLPPGTKTDLWSMNHSTGMFESLGTMTVSQDGESVVSDPGVGLQGSSWHTTIPVIEGIDDDTTKDCEECQATNSATALRTGANWVERELVSYRSMDETRGLTLLYDSSTLGVHKTDAPAQQLIQQRVMSVRIKMGTRIVQGGGFVNAGTPPTVRATFSIAGRPAGGQNYTGVAGWGTIAGTIDLVDAAGQPLPTGVYTTNLHIDYSFGGSTVSADVPGEVVAHNEQNSSFGAGWTLAGLQRLSFSAGSYAAISESGSTPQIFRFSPANSTFTSPPGDFTVVSRQADGRFARSYPNGRLVVFDVAGRMASDSDRYGNTTAYSYDAAGRLVRITDPVGLVTRLEYGASGRLARAIDPANRVTTFIYDPAGTLRSVTDPSTGPEPSITSYTYDANGRLLTQRHPEGNTTTYTYDSSGRVQSVTFADGQKRVFRPAENANLAEDLPDMAPIPSVLSSTDVITDERGSATTFLTDRFGRVIQTRDALGRTFDYARDANGLLLSARYPDGTTFSHTYDSRGYLLSMASSRWGAVRVTRDARFGQITSFTDRLGRVTRFTLDDRGRPISVLDAAGRTTTFTYNTRGQIEKMTDPLLRETRYEYNQYGNLAKVTKPGGRVWTLKYDTQGNLLTATNPINQTWAGTYDAMNRLLDVTDPSATKTSSTYDLNGYLTGWTDEAGNLTTYQYDALNRLTAVTDANKVSTVAARDRRGNVSTITDPRGVKTTLGYDALDREVSYDTPGISTTTTYNIAGDVERFAGNGLETTIAADRNLWEQPARVEWDALDSRPLDGSVRYDYRAGTGALAAAAAEPGLLPEQTADEPVVAPAPASAPAEAPAEAPAQAPAPPQRAVAAAPQSPVHEREPAPAVAADPLATDVSGTITGNVTWTLANSPYRLTGSVIVAPGATLTVEPGVVIESRNYQYLAVKGTLAASGTALKPIVWRLDPTATAYWSGIDVDAGATVTLAYNQVSNTDWALEAYRASGDTAITLDVTNSSFTGSAVGVSLRGTAARTFSGNTLRSPDRPLWLYDGAALATPLAGNTLPDGGRIHLGSATLLGAVTLPGTYTYVLEGSLSVPAGKSLTVQPGATLLARNYQYVTVKGTLAASGTALKPIVWRLDPTATAYWSGIDVDAGATVTLAYNQVSNTDWALEAYRASGDTAITLDVTNSSFTGSAVGVSLRGTAARTFSGNTLRSPDRPLWLYDGAALATPLAGNTLPDGGRIHLGSATLLGAVTLPGTYTYVLEGSLSVPAGKSLTVQPGATLLARNYQYVTVQGTLKAVGTSAQPIVWKLDPTATAYWSGIDVRAGATVTLAYNQVSNTDWALQAYRASGDTAITLDVTNSSFTGSAVGVSLRGTAARTFSGNTLRSPDRPLWLYDGAALATPLAGNTLPDGGRIHLGSATLLGAVTLPGTYTYVLEGSLSVAAGKSLTVQPGATLLARNYQYVTVQGTLKAVGTSAQPIVWKLDPTATAYWSGIDVGAGATVTLAYNQVSNTDWALEVYRTGSGTAITLDVTNSSFTGNTVGVSLRGTAARTFSANTLRSPGRPLWLQDGSAVSTPVAGNTILGGRIHLGYGNITNDVTLLGPPYRWMLEGSLGVPAGTTLSVAAGADVAAESGGSIDVAGTLTATGDARRPALFYAQDSYWGGLRQSGGVIDLRFVAIDGALTGIEHDDGALALTNVVVRRGRYGITHQAGSIALANVGIEGNTISGLTNWATTPVTATQVWWGSASGPEHRLNPGGNGDTVDDGVVYGPWQREAVVFQNFNDNVWGVEVVTAGNMPQTTRYDYDTMDRLTALRAVGPGGFGLGMSYDAAGQLTAITPATASRGIATSIGYDVAGRVTRLSQRSPDGTQLFEDLRYAYNGLGNVTSITRTSGVTQYGYDSLSRLISASGLAGAETYVYDKAGNRKSRAAGGTTTSFTYDAVNQLTSSSDGWTYTYDRAGNLLTRAKGGKTDRFAWNGLGQLTRVTYSDSTYSEFTYDHFGRRLSRRDRAGVLRYYVYDGPDVVQELDQNGRLVAGYVHGREADHPLSMTRGGKTYFFLYDRLGSVVGLTDGAGQRLATYQYDAWGRMTASGPAASVEQPFRFTGREWDADSGLYYFRARYYDPAAGRFISRDPIGLEGSPNLYVYVQNNPANFVDPTGLQNQPAPVNPIQRFNDTRAKINETLEYKDQIVEVVEAVEEGQVKDLVKNKALDKAKDCIAPGARKEQEKLLEETKKTTEESVIPFWDKIKKLWSDSTDATAGKTGTPPKNTNQPPPQRNQLQQWQNK